MLTPFRTLCLTFLLLVPAFGCAGPRQSGSGTGFSGLPGNNPGSGIVFSGQEMRDHRGTLLEFLYPRISGMVVDYRSQPCPSIELRGRRSLFGSNDPVIYLDGARAANSCILNMLYTGDIRSVEVYMMGITHRPGYEASPNGLILVFALDGSVSGASERSR